ncbi:MAG: copper amine oxidase N-terminal domain-containing protein, partial [Defluviitaleaceae bacterium]|nr:copper amine oxidase N-terminal domain-containing protein [Defluviitaleaceae bacterium]
PASSAAAPTPSPAPVVTDEAPVTPPTEEENHEYLMYQLGAVDETDEAPHVILTLPEGVQAAQLSQQTLGELVNAQAALSITQGIVTTTLHYDFLYALLDEDGAGIVVSITEVINDSEERLYENAPIVFIAAEITITRDEQTVYTVGIPYAITVDMTGFVLYDMNPARFVLKVDGVPIGGSFDPQTGLFTAEALLYTGAFEIAYIPNLRRVNMGISSTTITNAVYGDITHMDILPVVVENRTFIPIRFVAESLDATVKWNGERRRAVIVLDGITLEIYPDELLPGMDVPAFKQNDRIMIPLRFVAEYFNATVNFQEETQQIEIIL